MVPDLRTVISLTSDLIMNTLISLIILSSVAGSRVEVARCRAQCLDTLREDCARGDEACSSCWSACEDLDTCQCGVEDRGCQVACDWSDQANRVTNRRPGDSRGHRVQVWELATYLDLDRGSCSLSWGKVRASSNSFRSSSRPVAPRSPPVYVLVAEDETGEMWELGQTSTRHQELVANMFPDTVSIRLVVVGAEGVRLTTSLDTRHLDCENHQFLPVVTHSVMEDDLLRVSVTWDNNDVEESPEYVVRWREYSLEARRDMVSVMGTMIVQGANAEVTLRPNTGYILQVENSKTGEMSQSVIIDTTITEEDMDGVAVILLITTLVLVTLVMVALIIVFIYKRQNKKTEEVAKQNLNNNEIALGADSGSRVPLNLDYNNLC